MIYSFYIGQLDKRAGQIVSLVKYYMQQRWFDYGFELKYVCLFMFFFFTFYLILRFSLIFIHMQIR